MDQPSAITASMSSPVFVTLTFVGRREASRRMPSRSGNVLIGCLLPPDLESLKPN
jgi:hypothetical protein